MVKKYIKTSVSLFCCVLLIFNIFPITANATVSGDLSGTSTSGIKLSYSGDAAWNASNTTITGSVTGTAAQSGSCGNSTPAASKTGTLTISNNSGSNKKLSFTYKAEVNGGAVSVAGTNVNDTNEHTFDQEVAAGSSVSITITSATGASTTNITISNISLYEADATVSAVFMPAAHGSYTVSASGTTTTITKATTLSTKQSVGFTVSATAISNDNIDTIIIVLICGLAISYILLIVLFFIFVSFLLV